jgi:hypothetical protein
MPQDSRDTALTTESRDRANDAGRTAVAVVLWMAGLAAAVRHRLRLGVAPLRERHLRWRYGVTPGSEITRELPDAGDGGGDPVALTSGTAGAPKRVPYGRKRVRATTGVFVDGMLRLIVARRVRRPSLYVFGSLEPDHSLTSLLVGERRAPPWFILLQAPYRAQSDPALLALRDRYGTAAVRLLVLTLSNPGILYATNPSTLSGFLDEVAAEWETAAALVRVVVREPDRVSPAARRILRCLASRGSGDRLRRVAKSAEPLPIADWNPAFATYVCWTGGAVTPFLERLDRRLPAARFRREPMFSMSTETIETIPDYRETETAFLPAAPGLVHEFLEPGSEDGPRGARDLREAATYEMVVSHGFGLRRYATGDLFRVERFVGGFPDLRFVGRRGLGWSFTGEKLTAEQVAQAFERLDAAFPGVRADSWLALFPSDPGGTVVPGYRLAVVGPSSGGAPPPGLAERLDALLGELNLEYRAKRQSGRLRGIEVSPVERAEFLKRASRGGRAHPDAQFKFQPFYPCLWEDG